MPAFDVAPVAVFESVVLEMFAAFVDFGFGEASAVGLADHHCLCSSEPSVVTVGLVVPWQVAIDR